MPGEEGENSNPLDPIQPQCLCVTTNRARSTETSQNSYKYIKMGIQIQEIGKSKNRSRNLKALQKIIKKQNQYSCFVISKMLIVSSDLSFIYIVSSERLRSQFEQETFSP